MLWNQIKIFLLLILRIILWIPMLLFSVLITLFIKFKPKAASVFLKSGEYLITVEDIEIGGVTGWDAPFTGGFRCVVPSGTLLTVNDDSSPGAAGTYCQPIKYKEFEQQFIEDRNTPKYNGYALVVTHKDIGGRIKKCDRMGRILEN